jgi:hypothetical protein
MITQVEEGILKMKNLEEGKIPLKKTLLNLLKLKYLIRRKTNTYLINFLSIQMIWVLSQDYIKSHQIVLK